MTAKNRPSTKYHLARVLMATLTVLASITVFTGCSPAVVVTIAPESATAAENAGNAAFSAEISPTAEKIVRRFTSANSPIFDKAEITKSLTAAGFKINSLDFPGTAGIAMSLTVPELDGLLNKSVSVAKADKRMNLVISRESIKTAIEAMPASTGDYLDLLMAPVFTDEKLSTAEYEDTIGSAYGKTIVAELKKSFFTLTVKCPNAVRTAKTSAGTATINGSSAVIKIPLSAILTLTDPITASVEW